MPVERRPTPSYSGVDVTQLNTASLPILAHLVLAWVWAEIPWGLLRRMPPLKQLPCFLGALTSMHSGAAGQQSQRLARRKAKTRHDKSPAPITSCHHIPTRRIRVNDMIATVPRSHRKPPLPVVSTCFETFKLRLHQKSAGYMVKVIVQMESQTNKACFFCMTSDASEMAEWHLQVSIDAHPRLEVEAIPCNRFLSALRS